MAMNKREREYQTKKFKRINNNFEAIKDAFTNVKIDVAAQKSNQGDWNMYIVKSLRALEHRMLLLEQAVKDKELKVYQ